MTTLTTRHRFARGLMLAAKILAATGILLGMLGAGIGSFASALMLILGALAALTLLSF